MTGLKELKKEWNEKGNISTLYATGDLGRTSNRLEGILAFPKLDKVAVIGARLSVVLEKEDPSDMIHKMLYLFSLMRSCQIACFKKGKVVDVPTSTSCSFQEFSNLMAEVNCQYDDR